MKTGNHAHQEDEREVRSALQDAFPAVDTELRRALWPAMLRRMEDEAPAARVPWYDWALAGCVVLALLIFPKFLVLFGYHL
ncbi:MAG: hypothetical protein ACHP79_00985 [Terriglobales bacterium]